MQGLKGPYREGSAKLRSEVPDRLECWLRDGDKGRWVRAAYVKLWFVLVVCGFLLASEARLAAIPLGLLGLLWASRDWASRPFLCLGGREHGTAVAAAGRMGLQPTYTDRPRRTRPAWETLLVMLLLVIVFFTLVFWLGAQLSGEFRGSAGGGTRVCKFHGAAEDGTRVGEWNPSGGS